MKTWRFKLMTGLKRRELGSAILLHAHHYLENPANPDAILGYDILPFNSTEAAKLIWETWRKEGNFYKNHRHLNKWDEFEAKIRKFPWRIRHRLGLIWGAITGSKEVGYLED